MSHGTRRSTTTSSRRATGERPRRRRRSRFRPPSGLSAGISKVELGLAIAAALAVAVLIIAASAGLLSSPQQASGSSPGPGAQPGPSGQSTSQQQGSKHHHKHKAKPVSLAAELIPKSGAYLGAYVQPKPVNSAGEIAAVKSFQSLTGQQLGLVHVYDRWGYPFPTAADRYFAAQGKILLVTWSGKLDTRSIISGAEDPAIIARARAIKAFGHPILLEFRHEMDRPDIQYEVHGAQDFIKAWDHIRAVFAQVGTTNVGWVWCPTGIGFENGRAQPFYPGNSQVDWVCADVYSADTTVPLAAAANPFLLWARHTGKPILIGEFGVGGNPAAWPYWLAEAGQLPQAYPQIKGMAYFDAQGLDSHGKPFDYRLTDDHQAVLTFTRLMASAAFHPGIPPGL